MSKVKMPDGEQIYVRSIGHGEPVLLLSGIGMSSWQWLPFILAHSYRFKFIIPDFRGFGGSKKCKVPENSDVFDSHWQDTNAVIDHFQLQNFHLMGYSMGASISLHGLKYSDLAHRIKSYTQIDQTPHLRTTKEWPYGLLGSQQPIFFAELHMFLSILKKNAAHQFISDLEEDTQLQLLVIWSRMVDHLTKSDQGINLYRSSKKIKILRKLYFPLQRIDYLIWYIKFYLNHNDDYRDSLLALDVPCTFIIGEKSVLYPYTGQLDLSNKLIYSQKIILKDSGHVPLTDQPWAFSQAIKQALNFSGY